MKLGLSYVAFEGIELLEYAIASIRSHVDFISVVRQDISYHGNNADPEDIATIEWLQSIGFIDQVVVYKPDLSLKTKVNETAIRNLGLDLSIAAGCTHHISADIDEFYLSDQLDFVKNRFKGDCSVVERIDYYKHPTYKIIPEPHHLCSFIHSVDVRYEMNLDFPYVIDLTRRFKNFEKCEFLKPDEFVMHHMSYVRNDIRKKIANNDNHRILKNQKKFLAVFDKYKLGETLCIPPDFRNRKTVLAPNLFNIKDLNGSIVSNRSERARSVQ